MNQAHLYAASHAMQRRDADAVMREFATRLRWRRDAPTAPANAPARLAVLDVGSGTGDVTRTVILPRLPPEVTSVLGIDISEAMVEHARSAQGCERDGGGGGGGGGPRVAFLKADIASPRLRPDALTTAVGTDAFDALFSFYTMHWVQDQRMALSNMAQLLRRDGQLLLAFLTSCPVFLLYEVLAQKPRWKQYMNDVSKYISPYHHSCDPAHEFSRLLEESGFNIIHCQMRQCTFDFHDMGNLIGSLKAVNPFIERMPEEEVPDYVEEFTKEIINRKMVTVTEDNNNKQQKVIVKYGLLVAHAQKK